MVTLEQRMHPHPEVVYTVLEDGETVLLHLESSTYYSLNRTGTHIWQGLKQQRTLRSASSSKRSLPWRPRRLTGVCWRWSTNSCSSRWCRGRNDGHLSATAQICSILSIFLTACLIGVSVPG
jgi:hypothetical protein